MTKNLMILKVCLMGNKTFGYIFNLQVPNVLKIRKEI